MSAFVHLLPALDANTLYEQFDFDDLIWPISGTTWQDSNRVGIETRPPFFECPSDTSQTHVVSGSDRYATGSYALVHGTMGPSHGISGNMKVFNTGPFNYKTAYNSASITDGLSNTMFVGEVIDAHTGESQNIWTQASRHLSCLRTTENPINTPPGLGITTSPYGVDLNGAFASRHVGGAHFVFGDGHVSFLSENLSLTTYQALSTRQMREPLGEY